MARGDRRSRPWCHGILFHRRGRERQSSHRLYAGAGQPAHALRALGRNSLAHGGRDRAGGIAFPFAHSGFGGRAGTWPTPRVAGRRSITLCARAGLGASRRSRSSRDKLWPRHSSSTLSIGRTWLTTSSWRWAFNTRRGRQLAGPRAWSTSDTAGSHPSFWMPMVLPTSPTTATLNTARYGHRAASLPNGMALAERAQESIGKLPARAALYH